MKPKAIVTGGTTGIGFGIATAMLNDGYDVTVTGLTDEQVGQYVTKLESDIGTTINEAAFAQVTGANN